MYVVDFGGELIVECPVCWIVIGNCDTNLIQNCVNQYIGPPFVLLHIISKTTTQHYNTGQASTLDDIMISMFHSGSILQERRALRNNKKLYKLAASERSSSGATPKSSDHSNSIRDSGLSI